MAVQSWNEINADAVFYISVIGGASELAEFNESLEIRIREACHIVFVEDMYTPGKYWLEFTSSVGTKAHAVEKVKSLTGSDTLVCFGDGLNDLPLFAIADQAYAVANSTDEVKSRATAIIGSNADEGVAAWIETRLL